MMLWMDGFDWIASGQTGLPINYALQKRYAWGDVTYGTPDGETVAGRNGGVALKFGRSGQYVRTPALQAWDDSDSVYVGFAIKTYGTLLNDSSILDFYRYERLQLTFRCFNDGTLKLSTRPAFPAGIKTNAWFFIELYVKFGNSPNGAYEVRVNGVTVKQETAIDTQEQSDSYPSWTTVIFRPLGSPGLLDDIYILDDTGSINNTFLGDVKVPVLWPDDDHTQGWTRSAGADNYALVDDGPVTASEGANVWTDDDYVYSDTPSTKDLYEYADLSSEYDGATIQAVQVASVARVTNPQALTLKNKCLSVDAEVVVGQETLMWDLYGLVTGIRETDPKTSVLWTPSGVNAAKFGVEVG